MLRSSASIALATLVLVAVSAKPARADVIPRDLLYKILDSTPKLTRKPSPDQSIRDERYYDVKGSSAGGFVSPESDDYGYVKSGADLLIVPLGSGGSGGVFSTLLFTSIRTHPQFIGLIPSPNGHLSVTIAEGRIEVTTPVYGPNDPNCCPSGMTYITYELDGTRLTKIAQRTQKLAN